MSPTALINVEIFRDLPQDINEALSSLIFAGARCGDLPELQRLRGYFVKRYGLEFASASVELLPGSAVNKQVPPNNDFSFTIL